MYRVELFRAAGNAFSWACLNPADKPLSEGMLQALSKWRGVPHSMVEFLSEEVPRQTHEKVLSLAGQLLCSKDIEGLKEVHRSLLANIDLLRAGVDSLNWRASILFFTTLRLAPYLKKWKGGSNACGFSLAYLLFSCAQLYRLHQVIGQAEDYSQQLKGKIEGRSPRPVVADMVAVSVGEKGSPTSEQKEVGVLEQPFIITQLVMNCFEDQ